MTAKLTADLFKKRFTLFKDIEKREIDLPFCPECHLDLLQATASCSLCGTAMRTRMIRISAGATTHGPTVKQATEALRAAGIPFTLQKGSGCRQRCGDACGQ